MNAKDYDKYYLDSPIIKQYKWHQGEVKPRGSY